MDIKQRIAAEIDKQAEKIKELGLEIGKNPELGFVEYKAAELLKGALKDGGYKVTSSIAGLETAFVGEMGDSGPHIALLGEYDALPEIGHACGHNLIGAASVGAALGLAHVLPEIGGKVSVFGAPGEETGGGKTILVDKGLMEGIDAALMFHPSSENILMSTSNALDAFEFTFTGQTAHAAGAPEKGINALDGVILLFNGINALRQHVKDGTKIHGIITEGGKAANIVPERAVAQFYVRASSREYLDQVVKKVLAIAEGAAAMTGAQVTWKNFEYSNDNMVPNKAMAQVFGENLEELGITNVREFREGKGSSDMGNVSHVVPAIHPYLSVGPGYVGHTREFAKACQSEEGLKTLITAAKALAFTVCDLLTDQQKLAAAKDEHRKVFAGK